MASNHRQYDATWRRPAVTPAGRAGIGRRPGLVEIGLDIAGLTGELPSLGGTSLRVCIFATGRSEATR